jgi:hypothetical protein
MVLVGVVLLGFPTLGQAQSTTVSRGVMRGSLPLGTTGGLLTPGAPTGEVTRGLLRAPMPSGGTSGLLGTGAPPPGGTVGGFRGSLPPGARSGLLRGDVPAGTPVGVIQPPNPPGARLGEPGPSDMARGLQEEARINLIKGNYRNAEFHLRQAVTTQEQASGRDSTEVVQTLEGNATLLRKWNREAAASEMDAQVKEIRARQEPPVKPASAPGSAPAVAP